MHMMLMNEEDKHLNKHLILTVVWIKFEIYMY